MKRILPVVIVSLSILITACGQVDPNKNIDEGKVDRNVYHSNEIGWSLEIPAGWAVTDRERTKELNEKGRKAIEETIGGKIDYSGLRNLIAFQKNQFNSFQSTSEPYEPKYDEPWEEQNAMIKQLIYATYENKGIRADSTATIVENINGLDFHKYGFTIYAPDGTVIMSQLLYSRLINGFDFGVNISYNNDKDRDELLMVFRNSKFKK